MHTIVLATQKGGSGKSTLAIGLAIAAMQDGHKVRLIETDPQGTISSWQRRRADAEPVVEPVSDAEEIEPRLRFLNRNGVTLTIIDTAGGISPMTTAAIRSADLCLIPARPSPADIEATAPTLSIIRSFDKPFAFVLNQTAFRGRRIDAAATALCGTTAALDVSGMLALPYIVMRHDHQDALGTGLAVTEYAPEGKSAEEIRGLWQWVGKKLTTVALAHEPPALSELQAAPNAPPPLFWFWPGFVRI
jgi:chromosome partitioning protein